MFAHPPRQRAVAAPLEVTEHELAARRTPSPSVDVLATPLTAEALADLVSDRGEELGDALAELALAKTRVLRLSREIHEAARSSPRTLSVDSAASSATSASAASSVGTLLASTSIREQRKLCASEARLAASLRLKQRTSKEQMDLRPARKKLELAPIVKPSDDGDEDAVDYVRGILAKMQEREERQRPPGHPPLGERPPSSFDSLTSRTCQSQQGSMDESPTCGGGSLFAARMAVTMAFSRSIDIAERSDAMHRNVR